MKRNRRSRDTCLEKIDNLWLDGRITLLLETQTNTGYKNFHLQSTGFQRLKCRVKKTVKKGE
jgi:hypothetical protein